VDHLAVGSGLAEMPLFLTPTATLTCRWNRRIWPRIEACLRFGARCSKDTRLCRTDHQSSPMAASRCCSSSKFTNCTLPLPSAAINVAASLLNASWLTVRDRNR